MVGASNATSMKTIARIAAWLLLLPPLAFAQLRLPKIYRVDLNIDPSLVQRFLAMSMDADGVIWFGTTTRTLFRYDPRTGGIKTVAIPPTVPIGQFIASSLVVDHRVYMLLEKSPVLLVYDAASRKFSTSRLGSEKANTWYGARVPGSPFIYLFDRDVSGLVKWDTRDDTFAVVPYPYSEPLPWAGVVVAKEKAIYCPIWNGNKMVRFDLTTSRFTGEYPTPWAGAEPTGVVPVGNALYVSDRLKGRLLVFDLKTHRWVRAIAIPGYGEVFGFVGGGIEYRGIAYYSLSTYKSVAGDSIDERPYHFLDRFLAFDPHGDRFGYLQSIHGEKEYPQTAYLLAGEDGELYFFGQDIYDPKTGILSREYHGKSMAFQTRRIARSGRRP